MKIGLIGDYSEGVPAHQAIPLALRMASESLRRKIEFQWVPTDEIYGQYDFSSFDGIWCVPGSPYKNMDGALRAIRFAREHKIPFLGTCGGFQHAIIEYARNVLHWEDADHAESNPNASRPVISLLACTLVETSAPISFIPNSIIANAYGRKDAVEKYRCRFGLNPKYAEDLFGGKLQVSARDSNGEIRAIELADHPFFVATLFQPERAALAGVLPPLVVAFARSALD